MAAPGHPNSAQPVRPDGQGNYVSAVYEPDDNVMNAGGGPDDDGVDELDVCPTCKGTGTVSRHVVSAAAGPNTHVESDVAARALADQRTEAMAAYGALTGGLRMAPMPRN